MEPRILLDFLLRVAPLKDAHRHCATLRGEPESVAAHSWRLALMALLLKNTFPDLDMDRVVAMCLVHDFGEAVTGDIPAFLKTGRDEKVEEGAVEGLLSHLPEREREEISALFLEMQEQSTPEARLFKALDKIEAVIAHNESDLSTWLPLEYDLQLTYGVKEAEAFPYMQALRQAVRQDSLDKIAAGRAENEKTPPETE